MPGESGYDLMRKVVARKGENAPPAAALSAYASGQDRIARESGFQMLLAKPVNPKALVMAVASLAATSTVSDAAARRLERRRS
jgi:CheY-like chemotaxis protein